MRVKSDSEPLLIDIGGGLGHDLIAFRKRFPELSGKLIVQDIPVVVDSIKDLPTGINAMTHDFFKPQPVKGAKAYYLRMVLHDWPDKQARKILESIRGSMTKESILLINENVISESNVPLYSAEMDLSMMAMFSALDRTRAQFKDLLESSGFELVHVWTPKVVVSGSGTLFEVVLRP